MNKLFNLCMLFLVCAPAGTMHSDVMIINNTAITIEARLYNPSYGSILGTSGPIAPSQSSKIVTMSSAKVHLEIRQSGKYPWQTNSYQNVDLGSVFGHTFIITKDNTGTFKFTAQYPVNARERQ
ncbi:MAG: hypothetical protein WCE21_05135 [Candidatus Babeliales bacterium]